MSTTPSAQVAVVTGAARGIGLAIAHRFQAENYHVIILDNDETGLQQCEKQLKGNGNYSFVLCDVSDPAQVQTTFQKILTQFPSIHALVNNAGIAIFKPAEQVTFEDWSAVMSTNLNGTFLCTQAALPGLLEAKGSIVNIASISGVRASTLRIAYGTSKAAIMHLTKQQAVEYGNKGVRANAIAPGPVETEMAKLVHSADIRTSYSDAIPLARYGTTTEIADAVYFLCSPAAAYINGQILAVDGGFDAAGVGLLSLRG
ncbi:MAG: SDR family oxidoreductase [Haliscomenobacter sp.]|uniref:SDR family NAD(P)-dependent oxidoreductase n=1 Tax=Haliscomenobacter sp. TaxID=2717303 RepID=UPI0029B3F112|nr:SDR family oxidoreductase [Haliscomenobacter sp.]MDX2071625.1 SDR family oxidoreductase [Haliscomenobacter sp.]